MKLECKIVALTHYDVKGHVEEYATGAAGRKLRLLPDPDNPVDPTAVKVLELTGGMPLSRHIGYVAKGDLEKVWQVLHATGRSSLRLTVTRYGCADDSQSTERRGFYLMAEGEFEGQWNAVPAPLPADLDLAQWQYTGPVYPIHALSELHDVTTMLEEQLEELSTTDSTDPEWADRESEAEVLLDYFVAHNHLDFSREMTRSRSRIEQLLPTVPGVPFQRQYDQLMWQADFIADSEHRADQARLFFITTPTEQLLHDHGLYDHSDRVDEVEEQLLQFPYQVYRQWLNDPVSALSALYYKQVPRHQLLQLISGMILMVKNGRADGVRRWGKDDDQVALGEMKTVAQHAALLREQAEAQEHVPPTDAIREAVQAIAPTIKVQADWVVLLAVFRDYGFLDGTDYCEFVERISEMIPDGCKCCTDADIKQVAKKVFFDNPVEEWKDHIGKGDYDISDHKLECYCEIYANYKKHLRWK